MKVWMIVGIVIVSGFFFAGLSGFSWVKGVYNTEVQLRNRFTAQNKDVEATMDTMRKKLMSQYGVTKEYANSFIKVVQANASGRQGGGLVKFSTESNAKIGIDDKMFMAMQNSISGELDAFKRSQLVMVDVWREHKTFCELFPNFIIIGGKVLPEPEIISSDVSKDAIKTKRLTDDVIGANPVK